MANSAFSKPRSALLAVLLLGCGSHSAGASSLTLLPSADTSLMEVAVSNNNGGQTFFLSGTTQNGPRTRGLLKFDTGALPQGAVILSASLVLSVTRIPADDFAVGTFSLHRMLQDWGEGTKVNLPNNPGKGEPATAGEATWIHRKYPADLWASPGGASGTDYSPWESSFQIVYGVSESPYNFDSTPELIADLQGWLDGTLPNFGWMLICAEEEIQFTGRRFGSREDAANAPLLNIDYVIRPRIRDVAKTPLGIEFWFDALPGQSYTIEGKAIPDGSWEPLQTCPPVTSPQPLHFSFPTSGASRFFQIVTQ